MLNRRTTFLILFLFTLPMYNFSAYAQELKLPEAPIFIDQQSFETRYIMKGGNILVPALFLKHTGVRVDWNKSFRSVVFRYKDRQIALPVGKSYFDDYGSATGVWRRLPLSTKTIQFDGETFVPLIDVVKKLGMQVSYEGERTFITTNIDSPKGAIYKGDSTKKQVALTFDDGPDDYYTPQILEILKEKAVPATFFVVGKEAEAFPYMTRKIVNDGHGIANHTWGHPVLPQVTTSELVEEIQSTQQVLLETVGRVPDLIRPPYGAVTKSDLLVLNEMGLRVIKWSVDTIDWSGQSGDEILNIVRREISPGGIILQHNFQTDERLLDGTIEALPIIIDELQGRGYQFVTVQTLLENQEN
ncbi:polysaccharide deacetylase family protein [Halalkalibacter kiskunsagensis]|uniref:Polysaccharide deacetylase family protein n=1 Tax=Halalkalibacter kiskunsagensis TaxID=1548599 RepID=A0ABV6KB04_9BACI